MEIIGITILDIESVDRKVKYDFVPPAPPVNLKYYGIDLDGTLAEAVWNPENPSNAIGDPIKENLVKLQEVIDKGFEVYIYTARPYSDTYNIVAWLEHWNIKYNGIICGKPLFKFIIDDRCRNASEESWI